MKNLPAGKQKSFIIQIAGCGVRDTRNDRVRGGGGRSIRDSEGAVGTIKIAGVQGDHVVRLWPLSGGIDTAGNRQDAGTEAVAPRCCPTRRGQRKGGSIVGEFQGRRYIRQGRMKHRPIWKRKSFIIHIICCGLSRSVYTARQHQRPCDGQERSQTEKCLPPMWHALSSFAAVQVRVAAVTDLLG